MKKTMSIIVIGILVILGFVLISRNVNKVSERVIEEVDKPKVRVAFVIDDWGYNKKTLRLTEEIQMPLTLAILPNLQYSKEIAEFVKSNTAHDIILHLPFESKSNNARENNTISVNMGEEEVLYILDDDIKSVPGVIGVSNHQGSKATADKRIVKIVLTELKKRGLFFIDSITTADTVCSEVAKDLELLFCKRDVFLDITDKTDFQEFESYIKGQIQELVSVAKKNGSAIGIGHSLELTLNVIKDSVSELEKQGIEIVYVRELL